VYYQCSLVRSSSSEMESLFCARLHTFTLNF